MREAGKAISVYNHLYKQHLTNVIIFHCGQRALSLSAPAPRPELMGLFIRAMMDDGGPTRPRAKQRGGGGIGQGLPVLRRRGWANVKVF